MSIHVPTVAAGSTEASPSVMEGTGERDGMSPTDLRTAYDLPSNGGSGQTVAVVDAYNDPNAYSDLTTYRSTYKLPACTEASGCFKKVVAGETEANKTWSEEISLDVDMVSAICPECHILLVEAKNNEPLNIFGADAEAVALGATEISNSFGSLEFEGEVAYEADFDHPGIPTTVSAGDKGYGVEFPSVSPYVISVGGTTLKKAENTRKWTESVWSETGGGCSAYEPKPHWQTDVGCSDRTANDVAADASSGISPVSVYDTYKESGWLDFGGTSAAAPIAASVEALSSGYTRSLGAEAFYVAGSEKLLFDIAEGSNGSCGTSNEYLCHGETGYDAPTGWGTPDGALSFSEGSWAVQSTPNPTETKLNTLYGVSCTSSTFCMATGFDQTSEGKDKTLAETWNGSEWKVVGAAKLPSGALGGALDGVSCTSSTNCTSTWFYFNSSGAIVTLAEHWNGTEWSVQSTPNPSGALESQLYGVSCSSATWCVAVGLSENASKTTEVLAERWNGTEWTVMSVPSPSGFRYSALVGVSCTSSNFCMAGGVYENSSGTLETLVERWNGSEWAVQSSPNPSGAKGSTLGGGMSCVSSISCTATGDYVNASGTSETLAEHWNGAEWTIQPTPNPAGEGGNTLFRISCESYTNCTATGRYTNNSDELEPLAERWSGTEWKIQSVPDPTGTISTELAGVSCVSALSCTTVGRYVASGNTDSLAEHYH